MLQCAFTEAVIRSPSNILFAKMLVIRQTELSPQCPNNRAAHYLRVMHKKHGEAQSCIFAQMHLM